MQAITAPAETELYHISRFLWRKLGRVATHVDASAEVRAFYKLKLYKQASDLPGSLEGIAAFTLNNSRGGLLLVKHDVYSFVLTMETCLRMDHLHTHAQLVLKGAFTPKTLRETLMFSPKVSNSWGTLTEGASLYPTESSTFIKIRVNEFLKGELAGKSTQEVSLSAGLKGKLAGKDNK